MNLDSLEAFINRVVDRRLATVDRAATVRAVNTDNTVTLDLGDGTIAPSQPALTAYSPRSVGDVVLVRNRGGELLVQGKVGSAVSIPGAISLTISNSSAPGGLGWEEIVTGQLWARASGLWCKRVTAAPPATVITVTNTAQLVTYRGGAISQSGVAEQGDDTGAGIQTGLATFGSGAWSALSTKTIVGGRLTLHRRTATHGYTAAQVPVYVWRAAATTPPASPPSLVDTPVTTSLALNQTVDVPLLAAWLGGTGGFANGTYTAVALYSGQPLDSVEVDLLTLSIDYT